MVPLSTSVVAVSWMDNPECSPKIRGVTENVIAPEIPPPGDGFTTLMLKVPADAKLTAGMTALSVVEFTNVVAIGVVPTWTREL
jgi:hypothetical protein